jgi:hypothetical protein
LALVAGQLFTKYLNILIPVSRGDYINLPRLVVVAYVFAVAIPLAAIAVFGRRVR